MLKSKKKLMLLWQEVLVLRKKVVHLVKKMSHWRKKKRTNSKNSSISPSQDPYKKKIIKKRKSNRKQGAQKGHQGRSKKYVPSSEVDKIEDCLPPSRCSCEGLIQVKFNSYARHQQYELPVITPEIRRCCTKIFWNKVPPFSCFLPNSYGI